MLNTESTNLGQSGKTTSKLVAANDQVCRLALDQYFQKGTVNLGIHEQ
jgi:hypothetical protein